MGFPEPRMSGGMKLLSSDLQREWKLVISAIGLRITLPNFIFLRLTILADDLVL